MKEPVDREAIVALFEEIRAEFPHLQMEFEADSRPFDLRMNFFEQPGLRFFVNLNLQGDELHLTAGHLWLEWFPCTKATIRQDYRDAAIGLLSGQYRILEYHLGGAVVKARLQRPGERGWQSIGTWANLGALVPWPKRKAVVQNLESGASRPTRS